MCQLLGMNSAQPADIRFSFTGLAARGGRTDTHKDGFGIAFFEDNAANVFIDNKPACSSPVAELIKHYPIKSKNTIAHIRRASQGESLKVQNCHPFVRELGGRHWVFAHNGDLKNYFPANNGIYQPVGGTDSERAFCDLMFHLRLKSDAKPCKLDSIFEALVETTTRISSHGKFNFMLSNGQALFAFCWNNLYYLERKPPFQQAQLIDEDMSIDFAQTNTENDRLAVVATAPLTQGENWQRLQPGQLLWLDNGRLVKQAMIPIAPALLDEYADGKTIT